LQTHTLSVDTLTIEAGETQLKAIFVFVSVFVRHHLLLPEGGEPQLKAMMNCLRNDDGIDYLYFCSSFGSLGSQVNPEA
jgi:hypothetical protein